MFARTFYCASRLEGTICEISCGEIYLPQLYSAGQVKDRTNQPRVGSVTDRLPLYNGVFLASILTSIRLKVFQDIRLKGYLCNTYRGSNFIEESWNELK